MPLSLNISPFKYLSSLEDYKEGMFDNSVNTTTSIQPVRFIRTLHQAYYESTFGAYVLLLYIQKEL